MRLEPTILRSGVTYSTSQRPRGCHFRYTRVVHSTTEETKLRHHYQLMFDKTIQGGKKSLQQMVMGQQDAHIQKNEVGEKIKLDLQLAPHTKITSKESNTET